MTSDDWYLHANWSEEDQQEFFKRIKRARAKKAFIIRAKANVLFFTGQREQIEAAIALYQYGIATCPNSDLLTSLHLMIHALMKPSAISIKP